MREDCVSTPRGRVHYCLEGDGPPRLLLLHSVGLSLHHYDLALPYLTSSARVIVCDLPGHGDSDPLAEPLAIADYASSVAGLIEALGLERLTVGGCSLGALISTALSRDHPERLSGVVPCEASALQGDQWQAVWPVVERGFGVPTQTLEQIEPRFCNATQELLGHWNRDRNKAGGESMMSAMRAIRDFDLLAAALLDFVHSGARD